MADALDSKVGPMFCGLLQESEDIVYEEVLDYRKVRAIVEEKLEDYNVEPKLIPMDLSMFKDAIMHVCRIHRVILQPRGNMMLVGVGGSGRSSLTRLAAFIAGMVKNEVCFSRFELIFFSISEYIQHRDHQKLPSV